MSNKAELLNILNNSLGFRKTQEVLQLLDTPGNDTQQKRNLWIQASIQASKDEEIKRHYIEAWQDEESKREILELKSEQAKQRAKEEQKARQLEFLEDQEPPPKPKPIKLDLYIQSLEADRKKLDDELKRIQKSLDDLNEEAVVRLEESEKKVQNALEESDINLNAQKIRFLDILLDKIKANEEKGITDHSQALQWFRNVGPSPSSDRESEEEKKVVEELAKADSPLRKACEEMAECKKDLEKKYDDIADNFFEKEEKRQNIVEKLKEQPVQQWIAKSLQPEKQGKRKEDEDEERKEEEQKEAIAAMMRPKFR